MFSIFNISGLKNTRSTRIYKETTEIILWSLLVKDFRKTNWFSETQTQIGLGFQKNISSRHKNE